MTQESQPSTSQTSDRWSLQKWPFVEWDSEQVFHDGDGYFDSLISGIRQATSSIDFEVYIFQEDALGERVAAELIAAAERGIRVRILVDGVGSPFWSGNYLPKFSRAGVQAKVYHPLPWVFWSFSTRLRRGFNRFLSLFLKVNRRDHRKVCVIDGVTAWVGSMNVSVYHLRSMMRENAWRDCGARVVGAAVVELSGAFEKAWRKARGPGRGVQRGFFAKKRGKLRKESLSDLVRLNDTRRRRRLHQMDLLQRISRARHRVWVTTAYFVPQRAFVQELRFAAALGVDVRVLLPQKSDVFFMSWVMTGFYMELLSAGVRIFEYQPCVLHAKTMVVDGWALVGSSNLNYRSWIHDLEVDVVLKGEHVRRSLEAQFEKDQALSREIKREELGKISVFRRWGGRLFLLFRYWI